MTEKIEYKGYWFLPNKKEKAVAGVLTYTPKVSIVLELIGSFYENYSEIFSDNNGEDVVHGFTSDAKNITLLSCFPSSSLNFSSSFPITEYSCQYLIVGKHINSLDDPSFYKARVLFPQLTYWCLPRAIRSVESNDKEENIKTITISFDHYYNTNKDTISETQIDENTHLYLKKGVDYNNSNFFLTPKIEQYTCLEIHKQKDSSIADYLSDIFLYEQFLSLATLETVECSEIILYDRNSFQEFKEGLRRYDKIELIYIQNNDPGNYVATKRHNYLFIFDTIKEQYCQIIKKWYAEKDEIAPIRAHLIESIKHKGIFSSVDFLIVVQALEGFCIRFRNEDTFTNMLQNIVSEFSVIDKLKKDHICIKEIVDSRHYYSHFMKKSKKKHILDGLELYDLTHNLRKILICCLLHFIGFEYSQINEIFNKCNSNLLSNRTVFLKNKKRIDGCE